MPRSGANLALLLLNGFRSLADAATKELERRGYPDVRPAHEFAMRGIAAGAGNASALGRRLGISKQAASKTIALLQERGYVTRDHDSSDARKKQLEITALGLQMLNEGEAIFEELRHAWEQQIGSARLKTLEVILTALVGAFPEA